MIIDHQIIIMYCHRESGGGGLVSPLPLCMPHCPCLKYSLATHILIEETVIIFFFLHYIANCYK